MLSVSFISMCAGNAIRETQRILDTFSERTGNGVWETKITEQGLEAVRAELLKSARRNTAVICKRATKNGYKTIWTVGRKDIFSETGAVRTNGTEVWSPMSGDAEWQHLTAISHIASLSALLHDIGKSTDAFQEMLSGRIKSKNVYRHEWASLLMFCHFVETVSVQETGDTEWLAAISNGAYSATDWIETDYRKWDRETTETPFKRLSGRPLATMIGYIIVSHHRMPIRPSADCSYLMSAIRNGGNEITAEWNEPYVKDAPNNALSEKYRTISAAVDMLPMSSDGWKNRAAHDAGYLIATGRDLSIADVAVTRLARLAMMAADHKISAEKTSQRIPVAVSADKMPDKLYANTISERQGDRRKKEKTYYGQGLTQHLLMVARMASQIVQSFTSEVPVLHEAPKSLLHRAGGRFAWQDDAVDRANMMRDEFAEPGGFCVCMASTGTGKTIGTAKIMNAWSGGLRLSYALGLRALTRQTGAAYIKDIGIGKGDISVVIGGVNEAGDIASEPGVSDNTDDERSEREIAASEGSESAATILDQMADVEMIGRARQHDRIPLFDAVQTNLDDARIRNILTPPALVCTIDHLMPASETIRGGDYIIPEIRIMTADLILDEIDDYSPDDMPAIARLVYLAGVHGRKVILASATIPWAMSVGLFDAYQAGYRSNIRSSGKSVPCLLVDEFTSDHGVFENKEDFSKRMSSFISSRREKLTKLDCRHYAHVARIDASRSVDKAEEWKEAWVSSLKAECLAHHAKLAVDDPVSGTKISVGLIKISHVNALAEIVMKLFDDTGWDENVVVHVRPYHARYLLNHRSAIESMLDRVMSRREHVISPELSEIAKQEPDKTHLFLIVATSVCEVGRDWDADFAIIEPSSIRSIIQLAGRVQRHRQIQPPPGVPNVSIMQFRYRLSAPDQLEYDASVGGFERKSKNGVGTVILNNTDMTKGLTLEFPKEVSPGDRMTRITAIPRLKTSETDDRLFSALHDFVNDPDRSLGFGTMDSLETARIYSGFIRPDVPAHIEKDDAWAFFSNFGTHLTGMFPYTQKFRAPLEKTRDVTIFKYNNSFYAIKPGYSPSRLGGWYVGYDSSIENPEKSANVPDIIETSQVRKWAGDVALEPNQNCYDCARASFLTFSVRIGSKEQYRYRRFLGLTII